MLIADPASAGPKTRGQSSARCFDHDRIRLSAVHVAEHVDRWGQVCGQDIEGKEHGLEGLVPEADADALLVSLADKLHNATAIDRDLRTVGKNVFRRFTTGRKGTLWYYRRLVKVFDERSADLTPGGRVLHNELRRTVREMKQHSR